MVSTVFVPFYQSTLSSISQNLPRWWIICVKWTPTNYFGFCDDMTFLTKLNEWLSPNSLSNRINFLPNSRYLSINNWLQSCLNPFIFVSKWTQSLTVDFSISKSVVHRRALDFWLYQIEWWPNLWQFCCVFFCFATVCLLSRQSNRNSMMKQTQWGFYPF